MRSEKEIQHRIAALRSEIKAAQSHKAPDILAQAIDRKRREIKGLEYALGVEGWQETWSK